MVEDLDQLTEEKCGCGCCDECNCGIDCNCTEDNKCCDNCTCGEHRKGENGNTCDCVDECNCGDTCGCEEECNCDENCTCGDNCECTPDDKCNTDCNCQHSCDEDKCDCGADCSRGEECDCDKDCTGENAECKCEANECERERKDDCCEIEEKPDYFTRLITLQAEFDNYRKRTQTDVSKAYQNGFNEAITKFLPALDSFKMATEYITDQNTLIGIQYIEKGILSTLEKMGIETIDVSGKFDPNFHQAIESKQSQEHESGDIIKECFKGFKMGDKVIRHAQVIVAK